MGRHALRCPKMRHVPVRTVFQLDGAPPHFSRRVHAFQTWSFLIIGYEVGDPILWPPLSPESFTDEIPASIWRETECRLVCSATNDAHTEIE